MKKTILFGFTSAIAAMAAAPQAFAQGAASSEPTAGIGEVVVTAQRREESIQRAAISVDALSPVELENVGSNPGDLTRLAPSVQFSQVSNVYPQTSIRGVGNNPLNPQTEATVGFNYAGVPITRVSASSGLYYDLQRVEILKGPQGTLYGRNQTGGAVNIIPRNPILGENSGNASIELGNYDLQRAILAGNFALGENAALRGALNVVERDGFYKSGLADDVGQSGRVTLRVEPNDSVIFQLGFDYHHQDGLGGGSTLLNSTYVNNTGVNRNYTTDGKPLGGDAWIDVNQRCDGVDRSHVGAGSPGSLDFDDWFYTTPGANSVCRKDAHRNDDFYGLTGLLEWNVAGGTLTVIPAARRTKLDTISVGATNLVNIEDSDTSSLEARFASDPAARFSYIVGGLLLDESVESDFQIPIAYPNNFPTRQVLKQGTDSWAVFAAGRLSLADPLRLTAGVRYTQDDKVFGGTSAPTSTTPQPSLTIAAEKSWNEVTYNGGIEWDVAAESLLYLNYARGYKAGGFFFASPRAGFGPGTAVPPTVTSNSFDPEYVNAITLGSKNYFFNRRLLVNLEVFDYQYQKQQVSQFGRDDWNNDGVYDNQVFLTVNLGTVDILGAELDTQFLVTENTLLSLNVQRLDTSISGTVTNAGLNTAGFPALNAADWTGTFGIQQTIPLGNGAEIVADLRGQYRGNIFIGSTDYLPYMEAEPVTTGDFSLSYDSGGAWRLTGYVNNFTDEAVPAFYAGVGLAKAAFLGPGSSTPITASYRAPRTYGARLALQF